MDQYAQRRGRLLTSSRPMPDFEVVSASGPWLYRRDGSRIFDGSSGLLCASVGQSSPRVWARIEEQFPRYTYGGAAVVRPRVQMELMDRLCTAVGRPEDSVAMVTCGTLGVEVAIGLARNIARARWGKQRADILTADLSYHGMSAFTLALAGNHARRPRKEDALGLTPAYPAPYPPTHDHGEEACQAVCADEIAAEIDRRGAQNVAAVLLEPVNGSTGGCFVPPDGYLRRVAEICRERDVLVIHDEVLTGLWRTGTPLASDHWTGAAPDLVILSKGLGGGYTGVAAVLVAPQLAPWIRDPGADPLPALGTMATHPLQAAACLGVLDELEAMDPGAFQARCHQLGNELHALTSLPGVRSVRGRGHLYGVELEPGLLWPLMAQAEKNGVFLYPFTGAGHPKSEGLVIAPPLNCTSDELGFLTQALAYAVRAIA